MNRLDNEVKKQKGSNDKKLREEIQRLKENVNELDQQQKSISNTLLGPPVPVEILPTTV